MSAVEQIFLDTNVLVYPHDRMEPKKGPSAVSMLGRLLGLGRPLVSIQVLSEFFWSTTRKIPFDRLKPPAPKRHAKWLKEVLTRIHAETKSASQA